MANFRLSQIKIQNRNKRTIVLVGGTFDLVHSKHIEFLERSKNFGDILVVGLASDMDVKKRKGNNRPINNEKERAMHVLALKPVDYVFISDKSAYNEEIISVLKPDVLVFPLENNTKLYRKAYKSKYEKKFLGLTVKFINTKSSMSTSGIIHKICQTHLDHADS